MATNTGGGTTTSFGNTPQATNDSYSVSEDGSYAFDVMADDLGGNAKTLWSIDDGSSSTDLLTADSARAEGTSSDTSFLGAKIWITADGKIGYDASFFNYLGAGETTTDHFTYAIRLGNGTLSWATVYVTIAGSNDMPSITSAAQIGHVTEDVPGAAAASGTIAFTDADLSDMHTAIAQAATTNTTHLGAFALAPVSEAANAANGSVGWSYTIDEVAAQYLAAGETATENYVVTVGDGHGGTVSQTVTVTITGTNDLPTITSAAQAGSVTEDDPAAASAAGTVAFTDVDLRDSHSASAAQAVTDATHLGTFSLGSSVAEAPGAAGGSVGWTYTINEAAAQYLAAGQTVTEHYVVTLDDGNGGTAQQVVAVTITGTNDAPTIDTAGTDASGTVMEDAGNPILSDGGTIAFTDVDLTDVHTAIATADSGNPLGGTLILGSPSEDLATQGGTVGWTYQVSNAATQYLAEGQTVTETFVVDISDGHGGGVQQTVSVTVTGSEDAPTIAASTQAGAVTEDGVPTSTSGSFGFSDVDLVDLHTVGVTPAASGYVGALTASVATDSTGTGSGQVQWSFSVDNAAIQYLGADDTLTQTYTVAVSDGHGGTASQTVTVTIAGTNDAPVITSDAQSGAVIEDAPTAPVTSGSITFTDVDLGDGHGASATQAATDSTHLGTFSLDSVAEAADAADGSVGWSYAIDEAAAQHLAAGETVTEHYVVTVDDGHGGAVNETVAVTITGTNDAPVAQPDTGTTSENATVALDVLANDSDLDDGAVLSLVGASAPDGKGTASVAGGLVQFDPGTDFDHLAAGASEQVVLNYVIQDEHGATSTSSVNVTVTGVNDAPVAAADVGAGNEDSIITGNVAGNDADVDDGAVLSYALDAPVAGLTLNPDGSYSLDASNAAYQHLAQGETTDVIASYTVTDDQGATDTTTLTVTITGTNDAPVAQPDSATTSENAPVVINILANDSDVDDGAVLTVTGASAPNGQGLASIVDNQLQFSPGSDFDHLAQGETASVDVSYTVQDEHGAQSSATVSMLVTGTNDAPVAMAVTGSVGEDGTTTLAANYTDVDTSDTHSVSVDTTGTQGSVVNNGDGTFGYTPNGAFESLGAGQSATDSFSYTVSDNHGLTSTQTVTVTVNGAEDAPQLAATIGEQHVAEDTAWSFSVPSGTFIDPDAGDSLTYTAAMGDGTALPGWLEFDAATKTFSGTPPQDFNGSLTLSVTASDGSLTASNVFDLIVDPVNDAPVATPVTMVAVPEDSVRSITSAELLTGVTDVDHDPLTITSLSIASGNGTLVDNGGGNWIYTPAANDDTSVTFNYTVSDGTAVASSTATLDLVPVNDPPTLAAVATGSIAEVANSSATTDSGLAGTLAGSDVDPSDVLTYGIVGGTVDSAHGTVSYAGTYGTLTVDMSSGDYTYAKNAAAIEALGAGQNASDTFSVSVSDGHGGPVTQTYAINLSGANDAAVVTGATSGSIGEDAVPNTVTGDLNSTDVDGTADAWTAVTAPVQSLGGYGSYTMDASGHWTYTLNNSNPAVNALNSGQTLSDSFSVTTTDGTTQVVQVTINGHTDVTDVQAPTDIAFSLDPGTSSFSGNISAGSVLGSFTPVDADSSAWTFTLSGPNAALFSVSPAGSQGSVSLTAAQALSSGNFTFSVTATDPAGHQFTESFHVGVGTSNGDVNFFSVSAGTDIDFGLNGQDTILGGAGDDALVGGQNADSITGGAGADQLIGGQGADLFVYTAVSDSTAAHSDVIFDFQETANGDRIDLSAIDANSSLVNDQAFAFVTAQTTGVVAHSVTWYEDTAHNATVIQADINGDGVADMQITLTGLHSLTGGDFIL
jgi:VCBS repeat-containing protein